MANIQRLMMLRELVDQLEKTVAKNPETLDMQIFANSTETVLPKERHSCGTAACIAGWAALSEEFQELGLAIDEQDHNISYEGQVGFTALSKFFGIPLAMVYGLFDSAHYPQRTEDLKTHNRSILSIAKTRLNTLLLEKNQFEPTTPYNRELFDKAVDVLQTQTNITNTRRFTMQMWYVEDDGGNYCKTYACAAGWIAQNEEIKSAGLTLATDYDFEDNTEEKYIACEDYSGYKALSHFFGLSMEETHYIFNPDFYVDKVGLAALEEAREHMKRVRSNRAINV